MRALVLILAFGLSVLHQLHCVVFVQQRLPLLQTLDEYFLHALHAGNTIQCAKRCHVTTGCQSFLYSEKVCNHKPTTHEYDGTHSTTLHGHMCQEWAVNSPHVNVYNASDFPDSSLEEARNYCRDPNKSGYLWCYTTDPDVRRDPCDIPQCDYEYTDDTCINGDDLRQYTGKRNVTVSGIPCQRWDAVTPHGHGYTSAALFPDATMEDAGNHCRDPSNSKLLWCYTTDPSIRYMSCDVPKCKEVMDLERCYENTVATYTGSWHSTFFGQTCQAWASQSPWSHSFNDSHFPDGSLEAAGNFCRDPDGSGHLWCFTTDSNVRRKVCGITKCGSIPCKSQGYRYSGSWNKTYSGHACQRWDAQSPNTITISGALFYPVDIDIHAANNYCRDPHGTGPPWCYLRDSVGHLDCDIARCNTLAVRENCRLYSYVAPETPQESIRTGFKYFRLQ